MFFQILNSPIHATLTDFTSLGDILGRGPTLQLLVVGVVGNADQDDLGLRVADLNGQGPLDCAY
jgi:hypothetical protein